MPGMDPGIPPPSPLTGWRAGGGASDRKHKLDLDPEVVAEIEPVAVDDGLGGAAPDHPHLVQDAPGPTTPVSLLDPPREQLATHPPWKGSNLSLTHFRAFF